MADYIKREDVLALSHYDDHDCEIVDVEDVEKLPSADVVERKTGKWIDVDDYIISGSCSACGWQAHLYEDDVVGMNFCPNCGAQMEGDDNNA